MLTLLPKCEKLEQLDLESRLIEGRIFNELKLPYLRRLSLKGSYNFDTKALLTFIPNCPRLEHLTIDGEQIEAEEQAMLVDLLPRE